MADMVTDETLAEGLVVRIDPRLVEEYSSALQAYARGGFVNSLLSDGVRKAAVDLSDAVVLAALTGGTRAEVVEKQCGTCANASPEDVGGDVRGAGVCRTVHVVVAGKLGRYLVDSDDGPPWDNCRFWKPKDGG